MIRDVGLLLGMISPMDVGMTVIIVLFNLTDQQAM